MFALNTMSFENTPAIAAVGVNVGYQGESVAVTDPAEAVRMVREYLGSAPAAVHPARTVYHTDWGCPIGGEAAAAVFTSVNDRSAVVLFEQCREAFDQTTVSVATESVGEPTVGFIADLGKGDLDEISTRWQQMAAERFTATGTYVSGLVLEIDGEIFAMAEANPAFVKDIDAWREIVGQVVRAVDTTALPVFREVGFNYLTKAKAE